MNTDQPISCTADEKLLLMLAVALSQANENSLPGGPRNLPSVELAQCRQVLAAFAAVRPFSVVTPNELTELITHQEVKDEVEQIISIIVAPLDQTAQDMLFETIPLFSLQSLHRVEELLHPIVEKLITVEEFPREDYVHGQDHALQIIRLHSFISAVLTQRGEPEPFSLIILSWRTIVSASACFGLGRWSCIAACSWLIWTANYGTISFKEWVSKKLNDVFDTKMRRAPLAAERVLELICGSNSSGSSHSPPSSHD